MKDERTIKGRLIALFVGALLTVALLEGGLRIFRPQQTGPVQFAHSPRLAAIPVPNQHGHRIFPGIYDYTYTNDEFGLRRTSDFTEGKVPEFVLLFLGDSQTYGIGVNDEETFASKIARNLAERNVFVKVINGGNGGKGSDYALKFFRTLGRRFHPDLVALCFFRNDFSDNGRSEYYQVEENGSLTAKDLTNTASAKKDFLRNSKVYNWLIVHSHVVNLVKQALIRFFLRRQDRGDGTSDRTTVVTGGLGLAVVYDEIDDIGYSNNYNMRLTQTFIKRLRDEVEEIGSIFTMFYIPSAEEVELYRVKQKESADEAAFTALFERENMRIFTLTPVLGECGIDVGELYYSERHLTSVGHAVIAESMGSVLFNGQHEHSHPVEIAPKRGLTPSPDG